MKKPQCILALLLLAGCASKQPAADTRAADEAAVREADIAWSKSAGARQMAETISYYVDDASLLPPNAPIATGKPAITKVWEGLFALPGFAVAWQPVAVEVARSGDLAYSRGTYELTANDPNGKPETERGKYLEVWKKQADGSWKVVADMFSSDQPLPAPAK